MGSIPLHSRTVTIQGYDHYVGPVRVRLMPRTVLIREYEESQIQLRVLTSFIAGLAVGSSLAVVAWFFK